MCSHPAPPTSPTTATHLKQSTLILMMMKMITITPKMSSGVMISVILEKSLELLERGLEKPFQWRRWRWRCPCQNPTSMYVYILNYICTELLVEGLRFAKPPHAPRHTCTHRWHLANHRKSSLTPTHEWYLFSSTSSYDTQRRNINNILK